LWDGITIGSDPNCAIVLNELAPVAHETSR
jgi:hypothetical protein